MLDNCRTGKQAEVYSALQVVFNASPDSPADGLGYLAAARSLIRLNTISPALFPLPHALAREAAGADENIDLPDEDSEDATGAEPAAQQNTLQRLHIAAGMSHAVVQCNFPASWTRLESSEPLNRGEDQSLVIVVNSGEEVLMSPGTDKFSHALDPYEQSLRSGSSGHT